MLYEYKDKFVVNSVEPDTIDEQEQVAVAEIDLLGVTDDTLRQKLVTYSVYMELCAMQLENEGMQEKYDVYSKEYTRYYNMAKTSTNTSISTIPLGRG